MADNPFNRQLASLLGQNYQTPMQGGLLGAAQAVAPYAGYTTAPVSMGQVLGAAGAGASQGMQRAQTQNLTMANQVQGMARNQLQMQQVRAQMAAAKKAADVAAQDQLRITALRNHPAYEHLGGLPDAQFMAEVKNMLTPGYGAYSLGRGEKRYSKDNEVVATGEDVEHKTYKDSRGQSRWLTGPDQGKLVPGEKLGRPGMDDKDVISAEDRMYGDYMKDTAENRARMDAFMGMEAIFADPSDLGKFEGELIIDGKKVFNREGFDAGDIALIFSFMKMLDPRSIVRESEFEMAAKTGGIGEGVKSWFSTLEGQGKLTSTQRRRLMAQARSQFDKAVSRYDQDYLTHYRRAQGREDKGLNPDTAVPYHDYSPRIGRRAYRGKGVINKNDPDGIRTW